MIYTILFIWTIIGFGAACFLYLDDEWTLKFTKYSMEQVLFLCLIFGPIWWCGVIILIIMVLSEAFWQWLGKQ